jgi:hypothetical protein
MEAPRNKLQGASILKVIFYSHRSLTPQQDFGELSGSTVLTTMSLSNGRAAAGNALAPGFNML